MNILQHTTRSTLLLAGLLFAFLPLGWGNNINVSDVNVGTKQGGKCTITFKLKWENSWNHPQGNSNQPASHDAAWIFIKYRKAGTATWHHAFLDHTVYNSGSVGANATMQPGFRTPGDPVGPNNPVLGFFFNNAYNLNRSQYLDLLVSTGVTVVWNYQQNNNEAEGGRNIEANDPVEVKVYAIEMVHVTQGAFYAGDGESEDCFKSTKDGDPYQVAETANGYRLSKEKFKEIGVAYSTALAFESTKSGSVTPALPSVSDGILLIGITWKKDANNAPTSVKFGSTTLGATHLIGENITANERIILYRIMNPPSGSSNKVEVTFKDNNGTKGFCIGVALLDSVNQALPTRTFQTGNAGSKGIYTHDYSISGANKKDVVVSLMSTEKASISSRGTGQTPLWFNYIHESGGGLDVKSSNTSGNISFSITLNDDKKITWGGVPIVPKPTAGGFAANGTDGLSLTDDPNSPYNASFPTGFKSFYCMKYEITQAQYAAFLNTLTLEQQYERTEIKENDAVLMGAMTRTPTPVHYNGIDLMEIRGGDLPSRYGCNHDNDFVSDSLEFDGLPIACNFLSWADLSAWLDWAALRPMTELEYEKVCRGPGVQVHKYPWGSSSPTLSLNGITNMFSVSAQVSDASSAYNVNANGTQLGPLRVGIFARPKDHSNKKRVHAGASVLGVLELAGNLWEQVVSIETATGRGFAGDHGDGTLATPAWSEFQTEGIGLRGGAWDSAINTLPVSDRSMIGFYPANRQNNIGGRGVRIAN